jgi:hypothetical protein
MKVMLLGRPAYAAVVVAAIAVACNRRAASITDADALPPPVTDAATSAPMDAGDASVDAPEDAAREAAAPVPSYKDGDAELTNACPGGFSEKREHTDMMGRRAEEYEAARCMRRIMSRSLDKVLVPMKKADPDRFNALMKEQADWNVLVTQVEYLTEEWDLTDPKTGYRQLEMGAGNHKWGAAYVEEESSKERLLYARCLLAGDASQLRRRIDARQDAGREKAALITRTNAAANKYVATPLPDPTEEFTGVGNWAEIRDAQAVLHRMTTRLAHSTCTVAFPSLASDYGGVAACEEKLRLYYLAHDRHDLHLKR